MKQEEEQSRKEMSNLDYEDTLVMLNSMFEQYGVRAVMKDYMDSFPQMFPEVVVQINRLTPDKKVAALERPLPVK